jgi:hypothetical protein
VHLHRNELDRKIERQVPKAVIGRRLSQEEAKRLLAKLERGSANQALTVLDTRNDWS